MSLKAKLLNGTKFVKEYDFEISGEVVSLPLRPIASEHYENIQAGLNKGQKKYHDPSMAKTQYIDLEDATHRGFTANAQIFLLGIADNEDWTIEEVKQLPAGLVDQVASKILEISGIAVGKNKEEIDKKKN